MSEQVKVIVFHNNAGAKEPCGGCGIPWRPRCGPELFTMDLQPICSQCAEKYASPELLAMYKAYWQIVGVYEEEHNPVIAGEA